MRRARTKRSRRVAPNRDGSKRPSRRALPLWKKLVYSVLTCAAFFVVVELVLTPFVQPVLATRDPYVGFESTVSLFVERIDDGQPTLVTAKNKLAYFNAQQFPKRNPPGTYRIFCMGGSTTYGRPYDDTTSFPGWLRELLPLADQSRQWEVTNAGGISYASYRVAALMDELAQYQPDLFIIYSGHNEFLEERTYRELQQTPAALRRVTMIVGRTRTHSLLSSWLRAEDRTFKLPNEVDARLDHTVGPSDYHRNDQLREQILDHFEFNLARMVRTARRAGARVLLVVPAANVKDCAPFKSQHKSGLSADELETWSSHYDHGNALHAAGKPDEALLAYEQAADIDDRYAELHYRMGQALLAARRLAEARDALDRAADEDVCALRILTRMRDIVLRMSERLAVPAVDAEQLLKLECLRKHGHNSPGREYFLDHVHPTIDTNRLIAQAIIQRIIDEGIARKHASWNQKAIDETARRVAAKVSPETRAVALRNLAKVLNWAGKHNEAGRLAARAIDLRVQQALSEDPEAFILAAGYMKSTGDIDAAIAFYRRGLLRMPDYAEAHQLLGATLVEQGRFEEALASFMKVIQINPDDGHAQHMVGAVLAELERPDESISYYQRANRLQPHDAQIHFNMAFALAKLGKRKEAIRWYRKTVQLNPNDFAARSNLARLLADE